MNESNKAINESYKDSKFSLRISVGSLPFYIWSYTYEQNLHLFGERGALYAMTTLWLSWATQHRPLVAEEQSCWKALGGEALTLVFSALFPLPPAPGGGR